MLPGSVRAVRGPNLPVSVMARAAFAARGFGRRRHAVFAGACVNADTRNCLFSQVVDLMALVLCKVRPSPQPAIKKRTDLTVTRKAVYAKIGARASAGPPPLVATHRDRLAPCLGRIVGTSRTAPAPRIPGADRGREHLPGISSADSAACGSPGWAGICPRQAVVRVRPGRRCW